MNPTQFLAVLCQRAALATCGKVQDNSTSHEKACSNSRPVEGQPVSGPFAFQISQFRRVGMTDSAGDISGCSKCGRSAVRILEGLLIAPLCWAPAFLASLLFDRWVVTRVPYTGGLEIAVAGCLMGTLAAYLAASTLLPMALRFRNRLTIVLLACGLF